MLQMGLTLQPQMGTEVVSAVNWEEGDFPGCPSGGVRPSEPPPLEQKRGVWMRETGCSRPF